MAKFADKTTVPIEKTRMEIQETLRRFGADQYQAADDWATGEVIIRFRCKERYVQFHLQLPKLKDFRRNTARATQNAWEQACRSTWRALLLIIKAKLAAIEAEVSTFESEFLANIVVPDGRTVAEMLSPQLALAYETGKMPANVLALPNYSEDQ